MIMINRDRTILTKVVEEATALEQILYGVDETTFLKNDEKMRAVCMTLINVGELVKNLGDDCRKMNNEIPWKEMAGLRDVAAHGYFTLRMPDIWIYASVEMPVYKTKIKEILDNENSITE